MRRVLMISETFPPFNVSGSQRAFQFAKYLPEYGYLPSVVSAEPESTDPVDPGLLEQLDGRIRLERINKLGPKILPLLRLLRTLLRPLVLLVRAVRPAPAREPGPVAPPPADSNEPARTAFPADSLPLHRRPWHTLAWLFNFHIDLAVPMLLRAIKIHRQDPFDLVWVTGPSSRNLLVGYWASRLLRKPLVLDIRDPWTYGSLWSPFSPLTAALEKRWARIILAASSLSVFTSPLTMAAMQQRYPGRAASRMCTITNGHTGDLDVPPLRSIGPDNCLMSYTGSLNPRRRPDVLFEALQRASRNPEVAASLRLQFVGGMAGHEATISELGLQEQVLVVGQVSHEASRGYMRGADVNLLLQTIATGQDVIAGKTFEYLAARRPILAVVAPDGGDAWLLRRTGGGRVVPFDDPDAVAAEMTRLWKLWKDGVLADSVADVDLEPYSRRHLTADLARLLDEVVEPRDAPCPVSDRSRTREYETRVSVLQRVVPDYRVPFFAALDRLLGDASCKLEVLAGQPWPDEGLVDARDDLPCIRKTTNRRLPTGAYWLRGSLTAALRADLVIFEQANAALYIYPLLAMRMLGIRRPRLALWGHGAHLNKSRPRPLRDAWKKLWTTRVDHWFAYSDLSARAVIAGGFPHEKITVVENAIDTRALREARQSLSEADVAARFRDLFGENRRGDHRVGVFCARLVPLKRIPFLLASLAIIHREDPDFRMIIIGDGPDAERVREFCGSNPWCRWLGAVHGTARVELLAQADVLLNPGMTGLSILDAFAVGIPFATTDCGIHSPEIAYLKHGSNGLMTEPSESAYSTAVLQLMRSDDLATMKRNASTAGENHSIEAMARNFSDGVLKALG